MYVSCRLAGLRWPQLRPNSLRRVGSAPGTRPDPPPRSRLRPRLGLGRLIFRQHRESGPALPFRLALPLRSGYWPGSDPHGAQAFCEAKRNRAPWPWRSGRRQTNAPSERRPPIFLWASESQARPWSTAIPGPSVAGGSPPLATVLYSSSPRASSQNP